VECLLEPANVAGVLQRRTHRVETAHQRVLAQRIDFEADHAAIAFDRDGFRRQIQGEPVVTPDEQRRFEGAKVRKELRRELEARYRAMKQSRT